MSHHHRTLLNAVTMQAHHTAVRTVCDVVLHGNTLQRQSGHVRRVNLPDLQPLLLFLLEAARVVVLQVLHGCLERLVRLLQTLADLCADAARQPAAVVRRHHTMTTCHTS